MLLQMLLINAAPLLAKCMQCARVHAGLVLIVNVFVGVLAGLSCKHLPLCGAKCWLIMIGLSGFTPTAANLAATVHD